MTISAVILTKNSEETIRRTLNSLLFFSKIIIIDDFSSDRTLEIIKNEELRMKNTKIIIAERRLAGDFAGQRNFGLEKAKGEWVLFVDSDEVVTKELAEEIRQTIKNNSSNISAYYIKRRDFWKGREVKYGEVWTARSRGFIRLVKKGAGLWKGTVHERFATEKNTAILQNFIDHFPHQTIKEFLKEINFYSSLRAKELITAGKRVSILEVMLYPFLKFIYTYFFKLGFLDGAPGFVYAFFMSFHSFLVRAKLYKSKIIK